MSVVAGSVGVRAKFVARLEEHQDRSNANDIEAGEGGRAAQATQVRDDYAIDQNQLGKAVKGSLRKLLFEGVALNSTAFEDVDSKTGVKEIIGNKTETALLKWVTELGWGQFAELREQYERESRIVQVIPFSSERKAMGVIVKLPNGKYRFYVKVHAYSDSLIIGLTFSCRGRLRY